MKNCILFDTIYQEDAFMEELRKELIDYREKNKLDTKACADFLHITEKELKAIEDGSLVLPGDEVTKLREKIRPKTKGSRRGVRILDLVFRFGATIMALTVLLLCINGYAETQTLIALLSIGVMCSAFTMLPKIEK